MSPLTLKASNETIKASNKTFKASTLTLKESLLTLKASLVTLRESNLTVIESPLILKESALTPGESTCHQITKKEKQNASPYAIAKTKSKPLVVLFPFDALLQNAPSGHHK